MNEEVESTDESADSNVASGENTAEKPFDPAVTTTHSYLGNDLEVLHGRTLLDDGIFVNLPILLEKSIILFPEQTLPMVEFSTQVVNMFRQCIKTDRTFGVVYFNKRSYAKIGTTAEIYEYSDSPSEGFRIKARGRQRFKVLKMRKKQDQVFADVKILPEVVLEPPFFDQRLASLDRLRTIPKTMDEARIQEYRVSRRDSIVTPWPSWIYRQYDVRRLAMKIHKSLHFLRSRGSVIPKEPVELSFWMAQNLFMNNGKKLDLLRNDCVISRLQQEAKALEKLVAKSFVCGTCRRVIAEHTDIIPMNKQGLQEAYCNPAGAIHETVTLSKVTNVILSNEPPSTVCSWFPGYAWTIAICSGCHFHIGWRFTAVNNALSPSTFWGLTRSNLMLRYNLLTDSEMESTNSPNAESPRNDQQRSDSSSESDGDEADEVDFTRAVHIRPYDWQ